MSKNKSGSFLKAIQQFNEEERAGIVSEMEEKKAEAVKKAEAQGKADAERYVKKLLSAEKAEITGKYALKSVEAQGEIFKTRDKMVAEVFERCSKKLSEFSASPEYREKLLEYAREISDAFGENSCVVYVKADDLRYENDIKSVFRGEVEVKTDVRIMLGGITGYCESLSIVADNTLDSKLEEKKSWFVENADLKIS